LILNDAKMKKKKKGATAMAEERNPEKMQDERYMKKAEYDPKITKEKWIELINDRTVFNENSLITFACIKKAKLATCADMAEEFGRDFNFYNTNNWRTGERVYRKTNCPISIRDSGEKVYWNICCLAREANNKRFEFKIRPELEEAFEETGVLKNIKLYENEKGAVEMSKADELANLLEHTHNLILHGAPGTGKTRLARDIAKAMGCSDNEIGFVQFHPSYDYTDFVEGLRPMNDGNSEQIGFERKDGVFKKFCERAILSSGYNDDILKELNDNPTVWKVSLEGTGDNPTRKDCLENGYIRIGWKDYGDVADFSKFEGYTEHGGSIVLVAFQSKMKIGDIVLSCWSSTEIDAIGIVTGEYEYRSDGGDYPRYRNVKWLVKGIRENIVVKNHGKTLTLSSVYKLSISIQDIIDTVKKYSKSKVSTENTPFVFIIDEINRGEMSKIFGELFFSIDPGYRGKAGLIQTQYQNLISENNIFYNGFYVPENVYIIGTMNDIDRNVESMDYAFRRRFTFKEIKATDTQQDILAGLDDSIREDAIRRMNSLNDEISNIEGLSSAYHIGGAYFLKLKDLDNDFEKLWEYHLEGLLREYLRGMEDAETELKKLKEAYENPSDNLGEQD
jgi:DNA polymerase III delta prime subunit